MQKKAFFSTVGISLALVCANTAFAQYIWLNDIGIKQYSDKPPPKSVPKDKIIKTPFGLARNTESSASEPKNNDGNKSEIEKIEKPVTLAKKNEEFNKRKIAKEEADKKAETEQQNTEAKAKNCERAKSYKQSLDEGILIMTRNKNGERIPLDETQRAKEAAEAKKILSEC
ncbi:DUF4124 domain-containing protein [Undibacterium sp. Di24W]|uniref:DUF4124 domain-containing protein n=1 Tax=Undibacterium sp. Di24W TaxID=3413033 RepID=UPI003BF108C5